MIVAYYFFQNYKTTARFKEASKAARVYVDQ